MVFINVIKYFKGYLVMDYKLNAYLEVLDTSKARRF
jgi:hypothetical protein